MSNQPQQPDPLHPSHPDFWDNIKKQTPQK
jgi:hypothetical protein